MQEERCAGREYRQQALLRLKSQFMALESADGSIIAHSSVNLWTYKQKVGLGLTVTEHKALASVFDYWL